MTAWHIMSFHYSHSAASVSNSDKEGLSSVNKSYLYFTCFSFEVTANIRLSVNSAFLVL